MSQLLARRHLETFARLGPAGQGDLAALAQLARRTGGEPPDWAALLADGGATVAVAHEGESLVGAVVVRHSERSATARLAWLAVCPSARGRGIATLLVEAALSAARDAGAAVVVAEAPVGNAALSHLLPSSGFHCSVTAGGTARFKHLLWQRRGAGTVVALKGGERPA